MKSSHGGHSNSGSNYIYVGSLQREHVLFKTEQKALKPRKVLRKRSTTEISKAEKTVKSEVQSAKSVQFSLDSKKGTI